MSVARSPERSLLVLLGPTGTGKSAVALDLAAQLDGEIVGCDALQVYRGLNAATAKPSVDERSRVPHHLVDCVDPRNDFSMADYVRGAEQAIEAGTAIITPQRTELTARMMQISAAISLAMVMRLHPSLKIVLISRWRNLSERAKTRMIAKIVARPTRTITASITFLIIHVTGGVFAIVTLQDMWRFQLLLQLLIERLLIVGPIAMATGASVWLIPACIALTAARVCSPMMPSTLPTERRRFCNSRCSSLVSL